MSLWKRTKMPTFMPFISLSEGSRLTFLDILWHKRALTGNTLVTTQIEMRKDGWMPEVEVEIYRLIYGRTTFHYSCDFVP